MMFNLMFGAPNLSLLARNFNSQHKGWRFYLPFEPDFGSVLFGKNCSRLLQCRFTALLQSADQRPWQLCKA